jgi:competence protein ComEC
VFLEITFLDVGQGDAAFIRFPDGKTMLIDGGLNMRGYDSGERVLNPFLCYEGVRKIDLLLLSHPDNDHGGGFEHILREFGVKRALGVPHRDLPAPTHQSLHEIIDLKGIPHELGYAGAIDLTPTARIDLLHPLNEASINLMDGDVNNDSLVVKITYGDFRILFTGDIEQSAEEALIASGHDLRAEVIKVPHHGSQTSSSVALIDAVHPQYAVFSLGERNKFNFPSERVVNRYRERGCRVLRTDELGAIRLRTDGRRCWLTHSAGKP